VQTKDILDAWHDKQVAALKIDLYNNRKIKSGVEGFIAQLPALLDDKWMYQDLKHGLADKISY